MSHSPKVLPAGFPNYRSNTLVVNHRPTIALNYTPDEWSLYPRVDGDTGTYGVDEVARKLNMALMIIVNTQYSVVVDTGPDQNLIVGNPLTHFNRDIVSDLMWGVMDKFRDFGSFDAEPRRQLKYVLDMIFGRDA